MNIRWYIGLFIFSLLVMIGFSWLEKSPGYMDADYYYASGLRIANDKAWSEPFIWNYLADPLGLPQPSFTYWMPLAGVLSALGMSLTGSGDFWSARIFFILIAACISPLTAIMAFTFTPKRWAALLAGALALFSGFYLVYLPTTETFAVYMLLGGATFIIIRRLQQDMLEVNAPGENQPQEIQSLTRTISPPWVYIAAGGSAGLMYMTRADGIIWLLMLVSAVGLQLKYFNSKKSTTDRLAAKSVYWLPFVLCIGAFLLVSSPWLGRNLTNFGTIFAPGSGKALWLTGYDELFAFPSSQLTYSRWIEQGFDSILSTRTWALGLNAGSTLAVQGGIILLPFSIVGMWIWRRDWRVVLGVAGWIVISLVMTLIFPYQGARGGFFHAGAGFQILIWALVPAGLVQFVEWGHRRRNWSPDSAITKFGIGIVGVILILTAFLSWQRLRGSSVSTSSWGAKAQAYEQVERYLIAMIAADDQVVMVNNPPGYYAVTGRPAIVIPHGGMEALLGAAERFHPSYLVIDENFPQGLENLYREPGEYAGLTYLGPVLDMQVYVFSP